MTKLRQCLLIVVGVVALNLYIPVHSIAGSLDPAVAPAPTMKTLDQVPPTWSQKLQCDTQENCPRFELVLDGYAVLDKETGLVWQKWPLTSPLVWSDAIAYCVEGSIGGRQGWHLPTIEQLTSLFEAPVAYYALPKLPAGHPFTSVQAGYYWTATTSPNIWNVSGQFANETGAAWSVNYTSANVAVVVQNGKGNAFASWCVRGGQGYDGK